MPTAGILFVTRLGRLESSSVLLPDDCLSVSSRVINSSQEAAECHRERVRGKERRGLRVPAPDSRATNLSEDRRDAGERLAPALCAPFSGLSQVGLLYPLSRKTPPGPGRASAGSARAGEPTPTAPTLWPRRRILADGMSELPPVFRLFCSSHRRGLRGRRGRPAGAGTPAGGRPPRRNRGSPLPATGEATVSPALGGRPPTRSNGCKVNIWGVKPAPL